MIVELLWLVSVCSLSLKLQLQISIESVFLNERCQGALEAIGYLKDYAVGLGLESFRGEMLSEMDDLIGLLLSGSVVDFRNRIKRY